MAVDRRSTSLEEDLSREADSGSCVTPFLLYPSVSQCGSQPAVFTSSGVILDIVAIRFCPDSRS